MNYSVAHSKLRKLSSEQASLIMSELATILASDNFASSKKCQDFLEFIVERAIAADYESLTERFLGVQLFGRAVDYETATDSIVRVRASDVRRRLTQHYSSTGSTPLVRIDLIAGGYIPEFHWISTEKTQSASPLNYPWTKGFTPADSASTVSIPTSRTADAALGLKEVRRRHKLWLWGALTVAALAAAMLMLVLYPRQSNFDRFWRPVLTTSSSPVLSLPTTDTFQLSLGSTQVLNQMKPGDTVSLKADDVLAFHNWHVSLPVVQATLSIALALERKGKTPLVRMGTDLRRDELRGHPIIAIGSFSNPWTEQNVSGLRFTFDRGASDREVPRIRDFLNPQRSWTLDHVYPDHQTRDFAIVTRTFDPVTREPFLSLAGLHSFGNQIAGEFVSQDSSWNEVASRAPAGWEKMNLQVVLEANIVDTTPSSPKIVAVYFWK